MKIFKTLPKVGLLGAAAALSSCGVMEKINQPISDGGTNPLDFAGSNSTRVATTRDDGDLKATQNAQQGDLNELLGGGATTGGSAFNAGDKVEVVVANTPLFARYPQPGDPFKKVLSLGDSFKVLSSKGDYIKVTDGKGTTGYISSVVVVNQGYLSQPVPMVAPSNDLSSLDIKPETTPIVDPQPVPDIIAPATVDVDPAPAVSAPTPASGSSLKTAPIEELKVPEIKVPDVVVPEVQKPKAPTLKIPGMGATGNTSELEVQQ